MEHLIRTLRHVGVDHVITMIGFIEKLAVNTTIRTGNRKVDIKFVHLSIIVYQANPMFQSRHACTHEEAFDDST